MKNLKKAAWILLIVGGINRGLLGLFGFDLVARLFGYMSFFARVVYTIVGLCTVYVLLYPETHNMHTKLRK